MTYLNQLRRGADRPREQFAWLGRDAFNVTPISGCFPWPYFVFLELLQENNSIKD